MQPRSDTDFVLIKKEKLMKCLSVGQRCSPAETGSAWRSRINTLHTIWDNCFAGGTPALPLSQYSLVKQNKRIWELMQSWSCSTVPPGLQEPKANEQRKPATEYCSKQVWNARSISIGMEEILFKIPKVSDQSPRPSAFGCRRDKRS